MRFRSLGIRHAAVPAKDLKRAVAFYTDVLGFDPYHTADQDWAMVHRAGTSLSLLLLPKRLQSDTDSTQSAQPRVGKLGVHPSHLGLILDSREEVDQWNRRLKDAGIPAVGTPTLHRDQSYGFYLLDSEGNQLEIIFIPLAQMSLRDPEGRALLVVTDQPHDFSARLKRNLPGWQSEVVATSSEAAVLDQALERLKQAAPGLRSLEVFFPKQCTSTLTAWIAHVQSTQPGLSIEPHGDWESQAVVQEARMAAILEGLSI